jgi:AcrR family transcriptional regulator
MARTVDINRRNELLAAAVDFAIERGLTNLTLRPLADGLGVMPNTLVHHFGTKEELLSAILNGVRDRLRRIRDDTPREAGLAEVWRWTSDEERIAFFRSFFEAYGLALRQPESFQAFLSRVVDDWLPEPGSGQTRSTLDLAVVRGLLLDLLTTGDRARVDRALALYLGKMGP